MRPASTDKHYSPLAATSRSALRCSCTNRCVRSLAQSRLTPESAEAGTRSKRNFHRPESNWGIPLNSTFRVLIVFPRWLRLRIRSPRRSRDSVPQTRKKHSTPGFQASDFSSCYFSQAFKGGHFTKREMFSANALGAVHNCCAIDARLRLRLYCSLREKQAPRSSQSTL